MDSRQKLTNLFNNQCNQQKKYDIKQIQFSSSILASLQQNQKKDQQLINKNKQNDNMFGARSFNEPHNMYQIRRQSFSAVNNNTNNTNKNSNNNSINSNNNSFIINNNNNNNIMNYTNTNFNHNLINNNHTFHNNNNSNNIHYKYMMNPQITLNKINSQPEHEYKHQNQQQFIKTSDKNPIHNKFLFKNNMNINNDNNEMINKIKQSESKSSQKNYEIIISQLKSQINQLKDQNNKQKEEYKSKQQQLQTNITKFSEQVLIVSQQNTNLQQQINQLTSLLLQKPINPQHSSPISHKSQSLKFRQLGQQFQLKINQLYEQNYQLKNKLTTVQSNLQKQQIQNHAFKITIDAFQKRDKFQKQSLQNQQQKIKKQIQSLKQHNQILIQQKDRIVSDYQLKFMKLENQIIQIKQKYQNSQSYCQNVKYQTKFEELKDTVKEQINQIIRLKQKNKKLIQIIQFSK